MNLICIDIDGTLVRGQTQVHLVKFLFKRGNIKLFDYISVFYWYLKYKFFGSEIDKGLASKMYKKLLGGLSTEEVDSILDKYMEHIDNLIDKEAIEKINKFKKKGDKVFLVTSTIRPIAQRFLKLVNADGISSTELVVSKGFYTGETTAGINTANSKKKFIKDNLQKGNKLIVVSDHENDLELLKMADKAVVVNPTSNLRHFANKAKWEIIST